MHHHPPNHEHGPDTRLVSHPTASALLVELREHVPFSIAAVAIGLIVAGAICVLGFASAPDREATGQAIHDHTGPTNVPNPALLFFHLFHTAHMLFSSAATSAMFFRYERKPLKAILIGIVGSIGICGVGDIVIPHVSLMILGVITPWHICVYEHPSIVLPFAFSGVLVGIAASGSVVRSTIISHSLHVFVSTMASIFYMVGPLGIIAWLDDLGKVFFFVLIAVMVPCCVSDIIFPTLMSQTGRDRYVGALAKA